LISFSTLGTFVCDTSIAASPPNTADLESISVDKEDVSIPGSWCPLLSNDELGDDLHLALSPPMGGQFTAVEPSPGGQDGTITGRPPAVITVPVTGYVPPSQATGVPSPLPDDDDHVWEGFHHPTTPAGHVRDGFHQPTTHAGTLANITQAGRVHVTPSPQAAAPGTLQAPPGMPHLPRLGEGTYPHLQAPALDGAGRPPRPRPRRGPRTNRRGGRLGPLGRSRRGGAGQGRAQPPRIRRLRPQVITPVELREGDIICERGGRNTSHPGNQSYRQHIEDVVGTMHRASLRGNGVAYSDLSVREKTELSNAVVDWVHDRGGRFLTRDKLPGPAGNYGPWYEVLRETARQKVSQYLRDVHGRLRSTTTTRTTPRTTPTPTPWTRIIMTMIPPDEMLAAAAA
jgi:hypothetical protein